MGMDIQSTPKILKIHNKSINPDCEQDSCDIGTAGGFPPIFLHFFRNVVYLCIFAYFHEHSFFIPYY